MRNAPATPAAPAASASPIAEAVARLVRGYQLAVSPLMAPSCRYWPSCSEYAIEALRSHGALRGGWLAARRLARCHPWCAGGVDLVPAPRGTGTLPSCPAGPVRSGAFPRAFDPAEPIEAAGPVVSTPAGRSRLPALSIPD